MPCMSLFVCIPARMMHDLMISGALPALRTGDGGAMVNRSAG
jgi:hypothetical protein